jgi:hypothetical protein
MAKYKKKAIEVKESERPKKRRHINLPQSRNAAIFNDLRNVSDNTGIQLSAITVTVVNPATLVIRTRNTLWRLISLPLRSGRSTNLLSRFK